MDFLMEELERMGVNAIGSCEYEPNEFDIKRWQALFSMTHEDAQHNLKTYRENLDRRRISDDLWLDMKESKEAQGFDREAYEYDLFCRPKINPTTSSSASGLAAPSSNSLRGLLHDGPLRTAEDVRDIAGFTPTVVKAESEDKSTSFCYITAEEEHRIRQGLKSRGISFEPCFITINIAAKDLSALPKLGVNDPTLPQHRLNSITDLQHGYPVLYFFYGTLAQPETLK